MPSQRPSGGRTPPLAVGVGQSTNGSPASKRPLAFTSLYGSSSENRWGPSKVPPVSQLAGLGDAEESGGVMSATDAPTRKVAARVGVAAARPKAASGASTVVRIRMTAPPEKRVCPRRDA